MKNKDAIKLFLKKEGQELVGKHKANFWVLTAIFLLAILSIGFGSASLKYLKYKMDDPFVQWVDIIAQQGVTKVGGVALDEFLNKENIQNQFQFKDPQPNFVLSMYFRNHKSGKDVQLEGRSIKSNSAVLTKILDSENIIECRNGIPYADNELGIIITAEALERVGYDGQNPPRFVRLSLPYDEETCKIIGLGDGNNGYFDVSFPIVAVVKQLPGMYSFLFTDRFWNDMHGNRTAWDITEEDNNQELLICGDLDDLEKLQVQMEGENLSMTISDYNNSWDYCSCLHIVSRDLNGDNASFYNQIYQSLDLTKFNVSRIYNFMPTYDYAESDPSYYSIQMTSLDGIRNFQEALFENCGIKLDMTSIDAKENFRYVQRMGNTLSICIILISVIFICVFIYFLLNTHFQKIQRNLGTFKAFGVSNRMLDSIYILLLLILTLSAYIISFMVSWIISLIGGMVNTIELGFNWIDVWVWQNLLLLIMALMAAVVVAKIVANKKLKHTPGDLIYDRTEKKNDNVENTIE